MSRIRAAGTGTALLAAALVFGLSLPAHAQLTAAANSTAGSSGTGDDVDGFTGFGVDAVSNSGTVLGSRYRFNVNSDIGVFSTRDSSANAQHNISFNATAPGGYRLVVNQGFTGDMNRFNDLAGCDGSANISGVAGSFGGGTLTSGSLNVTDPGSIGNGGSDTNVPFSNTASGTIHRVSNGAALGHTLTFTWNAQTRSNSCEAAVRLGEQNGTTTGCGACGYPGSPSRTQSGDGHFVTVTFTSLCGNSVLDVVGPVTEQCDQGSANGTATSCCTSTCQFRAAAQVCRPTAGICDVQETCSGSAGTCPADGFQSSATVCRASAGVCDVAESCTGSAAACPANGFASSSTVCRASAGICDVAESCTGSGAACPGDAFQPSSVVCRAGSGDSCDPDEICTGSGAACPGDVVSANGTVCNPGSGDLCDPDEVCSGNPGDPCPADSVSGAFVVCRTGSGDSCDPDETCTGVADQPCPADVVAPSSTVCNPGSGDACDPDETCTGTAGDPCPADTIAPSSTVCRAGSGDSCDPDETCTGVADQACPGDTVSASGTLCRAGSGDLCDPDELCTGNPTDPCPADSVSGAFVTCRPAAGACDVAENCTGSAGQACPSDAKSTAVCRTAAGICDVAESCDGVTDNCPADALEPATTVCRPAAGTCDVAESCTGSSASCPADTGLPDTDSDTVCDALDNCDTIPNTPQDNNDSDPLGDACDPCTNIVPTVQDKAKITLTKLLAPAGDDKLSFKSFFTSMPGTPTVNPLANGARFLIVESTGAIPVDITIPGGAYSTANKAGWKVNGSGTSWTYKNSGSIVPLVNGITKVQIKAVTSTPGKYKIGVKGKNGTYPINSANLPIVPTIVIDVPFASTGQCGEAQFPAVPPAKPSCQAVGGGTTVKCK